MSFFPSYSTFKDFDKLVTISVTQLGILGADSFPSLLDTIYCLNQILPLLSPCHQKCIFFSVPLSIKFFLYCDLIIANNHTSSALRDTSTGLICPSSWGGFFFWKGWDLQWNFIWAGEAVPEHFLVLLILRISPANGSVSGVTLSGLVESLSALQPRSAKTDPT